MSMNSTSLSIVAEYFRLFRFGNDIHGGSTAITQKHFLSNTMAPDVTDGTVVGLEMLLKNWEFMTRCLPNVDMQPIRIENGPTGVIIAIVSCTFTITETSLRLAFPYLSDRDEGYVIAVKLVGQELTMNGTYQFHYDEQSNRVTCIKPTLDILTPLLSLLGSLENVAHLFENAVITPECKIAYPFA
ncbi:hypothetical protein PHMEG_00015532 [Phytophthora megakarya]|uniref:Bzip transcription factor n=1 Tax=Phytophthora megakarya TaxID=4795 RepID=A0A225W178_9STRA|nr:hypothetical protein PHMEG_00015532 [Phytophthora megakarya]